MVLHHHSRSGLVVMLWHWGSPQEIRGCNSELNDRNLVIGACWKWVTVHWGCHNNNLSVTFNTAWDDQHEHVQICLYALPTNTCGYLGGDVSNKFTTNWDHNDSFCYQPLNKKTLLSVWEAIKKHLSFGQCPTMASTPHSGPTLGVRPKNKEFSERASYNPKYFLKNS